MPPVAVRLFHAEAAPDVGPLERCIADVRHAIAVDVAAAFARAGARDVRIIAGPRDDTLFGARLRSLVLAEGIGGIVVAGSGTLAAATPADLRAFLDVASADGFVALANNRWSADVVAIARAEVLHGLPDLPADNALPRWLEEVAGYAVRDLAGRVRLQVDVDGPIDALLVGRMPAGMDTAAAERAIERTAVVAADRRSELLVAGRTSSGTLRRLETGIAARVRALVEERGLRAAAAVARDDGAANRRPPRSILGMALDRDGPDAFGDVLAGLADAAVVDTRVLLAHRFGADERAWPTAEDRYASDLLLAEHVADPWLRALTSAASRAPIPVVLGGHTVVGPGLPLVLRARGRGRRP